MEDWREFGEDFVSEDGNSRVERAVGFKALTDLGVLGTLVSRWWGLSGAGRGGKKRGTYVHNHFLGLVVGEQYLTQCSDTVYPFDQSAFLI